jgi:hypothetical protein
MNADVPHPITSTRSPRMVSNAVAREACSLNAVRQMSGWLLISAAVTFTSGSCA